MGGLIVMITTDDERSVCPLSLYKEGYFFPHIKLLYCVLLAHRMAVPRLLRLLNCTRHSGAALHVCSYSTLGRSSRPLEKDDVGPVFQYVGKHKKPSHKVFVWGFSFTGALGIPSFVVPDSGRKKPRKYQLTPYRLDTAEQVRLSLLQAF